MASYTVQTATAESPTMREADLDRPIEELVKTLLAP
jgi:hypothetical protein